MPIRTKQRTWVFVAAAVLPVVSFFGGMAINGLTIAEKIATKPYVDDRFQMSKKYTDQRSEQVLKDAFEHSDTNRRETLMQMQVMATEIKTANAILETKLDGLIRSVQDVRDSQYDHRTPRH